MQTIIANNAPHSLPLDVTEHLAAFDLTLNSILTTTSAKSAHTTASGAALSAMHYALPHRALARAVNPSTVATTAPRGYVAALRDLAERRGILGAALRYNGCPYATPGCAAACLAHSGHAALSVAPIACRGRRTLAMIADPVTYARAVAYAVAAQLARASRLGIPLAVRLCGTDETPWFRRTFPLSVADAERMRRRYGVTVSPGDHMNMADAFAPETANGSLFLYEYSKARADAADGLLAWQAAGWDVTASFAADRSTACADAFSAITAGFRVALPLLIGKRDPIPSRVLLTHSGQTYALSTVDGDATDARYADPHGVAVILREKRTRGADRATASRFLIPNAPLTRLADGTVQLIP